MIYLNLIIFFSAVNMINQSYLHYIPKENEEKLHYNLMVDVFYSIMVLNQIIIKLSNVLTVICLI